MAGFIFGGDTKETAESLARRRAVARALLENSVSSVPQNVGEGLAAIGQALAGRIAQNRLDKQETAGRAATTERFNKALAGVGGSVPGSMGGSMPAVPATGDVAAADLPSYAKAFLNTVSGPESGGKYDVIYGGSRFDDFSDHPRQYMTIQNGPNAGKKSSAAGKYQFLASTWDDQAGKLGLTDFSPESQDKAAWNLAKESYRNATGQDLDAALQSGDEAVIANVGKVLNPIWTSLPGGIEQGTNRDKFVSAYQRYLTPSGGGEVGTPSTAAEAVEAMGRGGARIDDPMLVYDDKGARMEPASYARTERQNPYSGPGASIDTSGSAQAGGSAQPSAVVQALANADIPAEFQQSAQLRNAMGNGRGVIQALLEGTPATDAQLGQARVRGNAVQQALASPVRADNGLGIDPSVVELMSDPYLSEGQRATLQTFIADKLAERKARREAELKRADPAYKVGLEKTQLELDNLRNPKISPADQARLDLDQRKFEAEQARGEWELKDGRMYNKRTGETKEIPGGRPPAAFKDVSSLRKEIQDLPSYKNLSQALPIYRSMYETAGRDTRASDLNLVYGLGKIMDPTSVVREGEMVMVKNTSSLPDWLQGAITSLNGGAALTPETRRALLTEAYGRVQGYDQAFQQDIGQYRGIVERNNMNMDDVLPNFGSFERWVPAGDAQSVPAPEGVDQDIWDAMTPEERKLWQN